MALSYHGGCYLLFREHFVFLFFACAALTTRLNLIFA